MTSGSNCLHLKRPETDDARSIGAAYQTTPAKLQHCLPIEVQVQLNNSYGWTPIVTSEKPTDLSIRETDKTAPHTAVPAVGFNRSYIALTNTHSELRVQANPFLPTQSSSVRSYFFGEEKTNAQPTGETLQRKSVRAKRTKVSDDKVNQLGLRAPQVLEVTVPGRKSLTIYNYHAPQGSGSAKGFFWYGRSAGARNS